MSTMSNEEMINLAIKACAAKHTKKEIRERIDGLKRRVKDETQTAENYFLAKVQLKMWKAILKVKEG